MAKPKTDTKQKLIETATDLIWRDSYGAVSVDEICQSAGVQKGSFYHFFPSKSDLALESMNWCMQSAIETYDDIFSIKHRPLERFNKLADYMYEIQKEKQQELGHVCGCPILTLGSELASRDQLIADKVQEMCNLKLAYFESVLRELVQSEAIDKNTDIKAKAEEIFALITGQLFLARIKNDLSFLQNNLKQAIADLIGIQQPELSEI